MSGSHRHQVESVISNIPRYVDIQDYSVHDVNNQHKNMSMSQHLTRSIIVNKAHPQQCLSYLLHYKRVKCSISR